MTVLIIDDDEDFAEGLVDLLSIQGVKAKGYTLFGEGLEHIRRGGVDRVFVDVKMPEVHGIEVAVAIHRINPDLPVTMMTGFTLEQLVQFILERPVTLCWGEDCTPDKLISLHKGHALLVLTPEAGFAQQVRESLRRGGLSPNVIHSLADVPRTAEVAEDGVLVVDVDRSLSHTLELCWEASVTRAFPRLILVVRMPAPNPRHVDVQTQLETTGVLFKPFKPTTFWNVVNPGATG